MNYAEFKKDIKPLINVISGVEDKECRFDDIQQVVFSIKNKSKNKIYAVGLSHGEDAGELIIKDAEALAQMNPSIEQAGGISEHTLRSMFIFLTMYSGGMEDEIDLIGVSVCGTQIFNYSNK